MGAAPGEAQVERCGGIGVAESVKHVHGPLRSALIFFFLLATPKRLFFIQPPAKGRGCSKAGLPLTQQAGGCPTTTSKTLTGLLSPSRIVLRFGCLVREAVQQGHLIGTGRKRSLKVRQC